MNVAANMWLAKYLLSLGLRKIGRGRIGLFGAVVEAGGAPPERAFRSQGLPRLEAGRPGRPALGGPRLPSGSGPGRLAVGHPGSLQLRVPLLQSRQQLGVCLLQTGL